MSKLDAFMNACYAAIADGELDISGFGNGVDRRGSAFVDEMLAEYPILQDYMNGSRSTENAFQRYTQAKYPR